MFELVLRVAFSLLVVFGLMWGLARLARRPMGGKRGTGTLAVLSRQQVARGAAITVVQVGDRALILGVTDQQVSLLGETDLATFGRQPHPEHRDALPTGSIGPGPLDGSALSPRTWRSTVNFLRDRTSRH